MSETALKPCPNPWCGSGDLTVVWTQTSPLSYYVRCNLCELWGPVQDSRVDAITAWNTRPFYDRLVRDRKALLEALKGAESHLRYIGYGDEWEREGSEKLQEKIEAAIALASAPGME